MKSAPGLIGLVVLVLLAAALGGCAGFESAGSGPTVEAPTYRVGDRWVYQGEDGFRVRTRWQETHEVTAVGPDGISVRVTRKGTDGETVRTERWAAPGLVMVGAIFDNETRRFTTPLRRYAFPMAAGQSWNQWVDQFNETEQRQGQINRFVRVLERTQVTTAAGTFEALRMHVVMRLDDEDAFRWATHVNNVLWYAPAVRSMVRESRDAQYIDKGDMRSAIPIRTQFGTLELVSFTPGGT
jgi:hypothetical protein